MLSEKINSALHAVFENFTIIREDEHTCAFMKGTGKNKVMCGRVAQFQFDDKWYCGKKKADGSGYTIHMGMMVKSLSNKRKSGKVVKAMSRKIADKNTQELINRMTQTVTTQARRAFPGGPYVIVTSNYGGKYPLIVNEKTQTVEGILVNKEPEKLDAASIKICRLLKLMYEYDDEDEVVENEMSESEDDGDEEDDEDELSDSSDEEDEDDGGDADDCGDDDY